MSRGGMGGGGGRNSITGLSPGELSSYWGYGRLAARSLTRYLKFDGEIVHGRGSSAFSLLRDSFIFLQESHYPSHNSVHNRSPSIQRFKR
jgi:hypothetical protein